MLAIPAIIIVQVAGRGVCVDARTFCIIEDLEEKYPAHIEGFGLSVFVSNRLADEARLAPRPYLSSRFYEEMLGGSDVLMSPQLEHAVLNELDAAIAAAFGISTDAVKKTWRNIYERVEERAPYVIPADENAQSSSGRGQEKRRRLLDYLRGHLEELRPWPN